MIAGITKVRNEEDILQDTLDHFAEICDAIYVYDDSSHDNTVAIARDHLAVDVIILRQYWNPNRFEAERANRQAVLEVAQADDPDWIVCFDADERFEMPKGWERFDAVRMKLFDFYITEKDKNWDYKDRKWMGPEYRSIIMAYRNGPDIAFTIPDQREMKVPKSYRILDGGYVKHYGKAISVEEWENTCDYYATHWPEPYRTKWDKRRGKAIHAESDFGRPLITWEQKQTHGLPMS